MIAVRSEGNGSSPSRLRVTVHYQAGCAPVLRAVGVVDLLTADLLAEGLAEIADQDRLRLDLSGVTELDSAGLALLLRVHHEVSRRWGRVELAGLSDQVAARLDLAHVTDLFPVPSHPCAGLPDSDDLRRHGPSRPSSRHPTDHSAFHLRAWGNASGRRLEQPGLERTVPMSADDDPQPFVLDLDAHTRPPLVIVRQWSTTALADLAEDHFFAVQLVATELVTNAYEHGGGADRLRLQRKRSPCRVHLEVDDHSTQPPALKQPGLDEPHGRGLQLVDTLCLQWGTTPLPRGGKTVWATIDCANYPWQSCTPTGPDQG